MNTIDAFHFVSDDDLAAVVGGAMNIPRPDFHDQRGVPGSGGKNDDFFTGLGMGAVGGLIIGAAVFA